MRVERLTLENWKGFESLSLALAAGPFTVLVGRNGSGKSSVFEALTIALSQAPAAGTFGGWMPVDSDIRGSAETCTIEAVTTDGRTVRIEKRRGPEGARTGTLELPSPPPVLRALWTDRTSHNLAAREHSAVDENLDLDPEIIRQAFASGVQAFGLVIPWYRREENLENEVRLHADPTFRRPSLEVVRAALARFATHVEGLACSNPRISRVDPNNPLARASEGTLVLDKGDTRLTFDQLSDGERFLLLTVMDLARRLAIANPGEQALDGVGIVLIDEVEQHLHPGWQSTLLPALHATFPNLQFIVTTHSPLVIASVSGASVRLLHDFQVHDVPPTYGKDANSLLENVFQVPYRPADLVARIRQIERQIDAEDLVAARSDLDEIITTLSTEDPDVVRLRTLLEFLGS